MTWRKFELYTQGGYSHASIIVRYSTPLPCEAWKWKVSYSLTHPKNLALTPNLTPKLDPNKTLKKYKIRNLVRVRWSPLDAIGLIAILAQIWLSPVESSRVWWSPLESNWTMWGREKYCVHV